MARLADRVPSYEELGDEETEAAATARGSLGRVVSGGDVFYVRGVAGGGLDDPRNHDQELVRKDVCDGLLSPARTRRLRRGRAKEGNG